MQKKYDLAGLIDHDKRGCDLEQLTSIIDQIRYQPSWRGQADKEADYVDGNQLDNAALQAQEAKGIPPIIENLIGIQIHTAYGKAATEKKDAKVIVQNEGEGDDLAEAMNVKLNKAEKTSGADKSCLLAHKKQIGVGIGWVEVSRNSDPFKSPYRTQEINRNEIWWDMSATEPDLSDAMWLLRRRWTHYEIAMQKFPKHKDLIYLAGTGWQTYDFATELDDGGTETGLMQARDIERGWSVEDREWRDIETDRVCIFEALTRHYCTIMVIKTPDGRVVRYDKKNTIHNQVVAAGFPVEKAIVSEVWKSYFIGCHFVGKEKIVDAPDGCFNYVPFFYHTEDRTGIPYGDVRGMMSLQDEHNARSSSMAWGLGSVRTTRTEGAVLMSDEDFRNTIGRRDADIVLDAKAMKNGGQFDVDRDYNLTEQQYKRMVDIRDGIQRQSKMTDAFRGGGQMTADSASGLKLEIDQSNQATSGLSDNYEYSRMQVLDHLLWMIIADSQEEEDVYITGGVVKKPRTVTINQPMVDEETGVEYKNNDVSRIRLKVALADVPSNPSLAQQELMSLTEFAKSSMPEIQAVLAPHIANLSSIPHKEEIVEAIREIIKAPSEEETMQRIEDAVEAASQKAMHDLKERELDIKESKAVVEIDKIVSEAVNNSLEAFYSATSAAIQIASTPGVAPIADGLLKSAGFEDKDAAPIIPSLADVGGDVNIAPIVEAPDVVQNTSPEFPPRVQEPDLDGVESDELASVDSPSLGINNGIETQEVGDMAA